MCIIKEISVAQGTGVPELACILTKISLHLLLRYPYQVCPWLMKGRLTMVFSMTGCTSDDKLPWQMKGELTMVFNMMSSTNDGILPWLIRECWLWYSVWQVIPMISPSVEPVTMNTIINTPFIRQGSLSSLVEPSRSWHTDLATSICGQTCSKKQKHCHLPIFYNRYDCHRHVPKLMVTWEMYPWHHHQLTGCSSLIHPK